MGRGAARWAVAGGIVAALVAAFALGAHAQRALRFRVNSTSPEQDIQSQTVRFFLDRVSELSGGRLQFQYFWSASLLPITETFRGVRDGLADISTQALSYASGDVADFGPLEVPFAWPVESRSMTAFHEEINPILAEIFPAYNQELLMSNPALLPDAFSCRRGFLTGPEDWRGKLFRTAGRWQGETILAWGARPVVIPLGDLYTALQRGTVDCTLLVYNLVESFRIYEVAPYITRADHSIQYTVVTINRRRWGELSPEDQALFRRAAREAWEYGLRLRDQQTEATLRRLEAGGARLCTPPDSELGRLRQATDGVWQQIRRELSPRGLRIVEAIERYGPAVAGRPQFGPNHPCPGPGA